MSALDATCLRGFFQIVKLIYVSLRNVADGIRQYAGSYSKPSASPATTPEEHRGSGRSECYVADVGEGAIPGLGCADALGVPRAKPIGEHAILPTALRRLRKLCLPATPSPTVRSLFGSLAHWLRCKRCMTLIYTLALAVIEACDSDDAVVRTQCACAKGRVH